MGCLYQGGCVWNFGKSDAAIPNYFYGLIALIYVNTAVCWFIDIAGAAIFAWGIAMGVGEVAARGPLAVPALLLVGGAALRGLSALVLDRLTVSAAQTAAGIRRDALMRRLLGGRLEKPLSTGESTTLAIDHNTAIENRDIRFFPARLGAVIGPIAVAAVVAPFSWVAAAIMMATLLPFALGMILAGGAARRAADRQLAAITALSEVFVDRITHLALIRHFRAEDRIARQVRGATGEVAHRTVAVLRAAFLSNAVLEFFGALAVALVAVYCGFSLLGLLPFPAPEQLTLVSAFFVLAMAPEFYLPMRRLAAAYHEKQLGEAAQAALTSIAATDPPKPVHAGHFDGVNVSGLVLSFPGVAVGPLSFTLAARDFVALTGPTGSGKTSTLAVLAGQLMPVAGQVTGSNGAPLPDGAVAWAAQRPLLVAGTLGENLALAARHASEAEVEATALRVGLGPLMERRGGLGMAVDDTGSGLSGGERRRIGLARAILSGRALILCDEPTADLDAAAAQAIGALLCDLAKERCLLVATHDAKLAVMARMEIAL